MKYVVYSHYAFASQDDFSDGVTNNSWLVGFAETAQEVYDLAKKEVEGHIEEEVKGRYDTDTEDEDEKEQIECFRSEFKAHYYNIARFPSEKLELVAEAVRNTDYQVESLCVEVIKL